MKIRGGEKGFIGIVLGLLIIGFGMPIALAAPIQPFSLATVEVERPIVSPSHRILLSAVREVNDEIRSDSVVRLTVRGVGQRLQVAPDSGRDEARQYYLDELAARNAIILYECRGRNCGRSNVWANQIFNEATLYGRDANQDYLAAAYRDDDDSIQVVLVYTVTRGNQREYVWVEQLTASKGSVIPGFHTSSTQIRGPIVVPWMGGVTYQFEWNANARRLLKEWADESGAKVLLNSYAPLVDAGTLDDAMRRAREAAEAMTVLLSKTGISRDRITAIIIGPAVVFDDPARQGNRIELMVVSQP